MKKVLTLIAILAISLSVCACSGNTEETTAGSTSGTPVQSNSTGDSSTTKTPDSNPSKPQTTTGTGDKTNTSTPVGSSDQPTVTSPDDSGWGELIPLE